MAAFTQHQARSSKEVSIVYRESLIYYVQNFNWMEVKKCALLWG